MDNPDPHAQRIAEIETGTEIEGYLLARVRELEAEPLGEDVVAVLAMAESYCQNLDTVSGHGTLALIERLYKVLTTTARNLTAALAELARLKEQREASCSGGWSPITDSTAARIQTAPSMWSVRTIRVVQPKGGAGDAKPAYDNMGRRAEEL